jgi:hypothetical protein
MIPSEYGSAAPMSAKSCARDTRRRAAALVDLGPLERRASSFSFANCDGLVDALEDRVDVGARLDELRGEPQRLRRRVRVLEAPGVGDERDVEGLRDLRRQLDPSSREDVPQDLAVEDAVGRSVAVAEARVVVVVVDVEDERRACERLGVGPILVSFAQSTAISTRSRQSFRQAPLQIAEGMNEYSLGSGASP